MVVIGEKRRSQSEKFIKNRKLSLLNPLFYFIKFLDNFILWDVFNKKLKFLLSYIFFKNFIFLKYDYDDQLKDQYLKSIKILRNKNKKLYEFHLKLIPNIFFQKYLIQL